MSTHPFPNTPKLEAMLLRARVSNPHVLSIPFSSAKPRSPPLFSASSRSRPLSLSATPPPPQSEDLVLTALFVPPGIDRSEVTPSMVLPGSNIVIGPYAGHSQIKQVEFVKSSARARDCPKDHRPEFAILGRSNVGKSSLINALVRKKDVALTSKTPGKTQLINHFLVNKSWYLVDLPGYGFANAPESARMDWSSFTKGYFLNRHTLVGVLLLVDASSPPQQIDLDCANWLGRNNIGMTFVFTKCDKTKGGKRTRPAENIEQFQALIRKHYQEPPPWIMTSSVTGMGRAELLLHMSQLRNYWDN
ncbi:putative GTP-binding protein, ribosome biogenesis, YsxC [Dioscorea sansibarensis]